MLAGTDPATVLHDRAHAVAIDASGDVVAAGMFANLSTDGAFSVVKLQGSSGAELWRTDIDDTAR